MRPRKGFIKLENEWFIGNEETKTSLLQQYGNDGLIIYSLLLRNQTIRNTCIFSINNLLHMLQCKSNNSIMILKIKDTLKKLNNNLITICSDADCTINTNLNMISNSDIYYCEIIRDIPKEKFFIVYDNEVDQYLEYCRNKKINKFGSLSYFYLLCKCLNSETKVCFPTNDYSAKILFTTENNIKRYNKELVKAEIIIMDNAGMNKKENNKYKNTANTYARFGDDEYLHEAIEKHKKEIDVAIDLKVKREQQDYQRKIKQLINKFKDKKLNELTNEEYEQLLKLEIEYYNMVKDRRNILRKFKPITLNKGTGEIYKRESKKEIKIIDMKTIDNNVDNMNNADDEEEMDWKKIFGY